MKKSKLYLVIAMFALAPLGASANSLQDIYELALQNDAQLKADKAGYEANKQNTAIARADLLPQINAGYNYLKTDNDVLSNRPPLDPLAPNKTEKQELKNTGWEISLTQPLFNMASWYNYKQGQKLSEQAEAEFGANQQSLIVRVTTAYFNVLRNVDRLEATLSEEKALGHQLEQTKQRFEVGLIAITEVHESQAAYDSATAATLEARGSLGISYEALEVLTGKAEDSIAPLSEKFPVVNPTPIDRAEWVSFALKNNYTLKARKLAAEAAAKKADLERAGHYPTLGAELSYGDGNEQQDINSLPKVDQDKEGSKVMLSLDVPLYSGGRTSGRTRQAVALSLKAEEEFHSAERSTIQNARALHLTVETDVARVQARKQAIVSNQSALDATQSGYEVGTRNLVEVLLAQRNLYQARQNYSDALHDYVIDSIKLREVSGMLTPADIQEVDRWLKPGATVNRKQYEN